jgi:hypothetical protein
MTKRLNRSFVESLRLLLAGLSLLFLVGACGGKIDEKNLVGKWRSSKLATPIYLHANGEWEIKTDEGAVLQYGVWQLKGKNIIWTYKVDARIGHDGDPIVSSKAREFRVKESDGSITTFDKLD